MRSAESDHSLSNSERKPPWNGWTVSRLAEISSFIARGRLEDGSRSKMDVTGTVHSVQPGLLVVPVGQDPFGRS